MVHAAAVAVAVKPSEMWHMDMVSDCQSVASLRWTAKTICEQRGCKPSAYPRLERELGEAIELC